MSATPTPPASSDPFGPGAPPTATPEPPREIAHGPRPGTVVWGLIVIGAGIVAIVAATDVALDLELTAIVGLAVAGALLLVTALVSSARHRGRSRD
ncbi:hypothetical protein C8046_06755 [Serinibacter arcticus]|uniref:Uncharacterized protein n=1 Tax=Serinibacter arcticus TaxID=1655435 RepID=A0A2U1ZTT2_9MICO|nr:hypothetical protein [Serinibacter arcticus]PWD50394.1 hypothetical protein C8046_06755 [Serinibacter arcticus]